MSEQHPITPPQWQVDFWCKQVMAMGADVDAVVLEIFRFGADQELEACCEWLNFYSHDVDTCDLRAARRPEPKSLVKQALESVAAIENMSDQYVQFKRDIECIRRALESLPD